VQVKAQMANPVKALVTRNQTVETAVSKADNAGRKRAPRSKSNSRSNSVSASQVLRTERKPKKNEGVRAFGAPLNTRLKKQQTPDNN